MSANVFRTPLRRRLSRLGVPMAGLLGLVAVPVFAQSVVGTARAIDGDSLEIGGLAVRLFGIDAPEGRQSCVRDAAEWACGKAAAGRLQALVEGRQVVCRTRETDRYGRAIAVCEAGGLELNRTMVAQGWATAFRQYSQAYVADEERARMAKIGLWSSSFMLPSEYRQAQSEPAQSAPAQPTPRPVRTAQRTPQPTEWKGGCVIKGNRSRRGEWIYHIPGMPYYEQTKAEELFCTEAQARAAGYRRAIVK